MVWAFSVFCILFYLFCHQLSCSLPAWAFSLCAFPADIWTWSVFQLFDGISSGPSTLLPKGKVFLLHPLGTLFTIPGSIWRVIRIRDLSHINIYQYQERPLHPHSINQLGHNHLVHLKRALTLYEDQVWESIVRSNLYQDIGWYLEYIHWILTRHRILERSQRVITKLNEDILTLLVEMIHNLIGRGREFDEDGNSALLINWINSLSQANVNLFYSCCFLLFFCV